MLVHWRRRRACWVPPGLAPTPMAKMRLLRRTGGRSYTSGAPSTWHTAGGRAPSTHGRRWKPAGQHDRPPHECSAPCLLAHAPIHLLREAGAPMRACGPTWMTMPPDPCKATSLLLTSQHTTSTCAPFVGLRWHCCRGLADRLRPPDPA